MEVCKTTDLDAYVKTVPAVRLSFAADDPAADAFAEYLAGQEAAGIWAEYGYEQVQ